MGRTPARRWSLDARLRGLAITEERTLAGRLAGALYLTAAVTVTTLLFVPHVENRHWPVVLAVSVFGAVWGTACLTVVPWSRIPPWVSHMSSASGLPCVAIVMAATGGASSPARFYFLFTLVYATYFYPPREAWPYILGIVGVLALPLAYDHLAVAHGIVPELVVLVPTYTVLGLLIMAGKSVLVNLREQAKDLALHDPLTGLANRRALMDELHRLVTGGRREADAFGFVLLDIDNFKHANTVFGHQGGDDVLRATGAALDETARGEDVVARLGGDEFAVIVRHVDAKAMADVSERLLAAVRRASSPKTELRVTASAGWACYPGHAPSVEGLIAVADRAMREAKTRGKNQSLSALSAG